ncbi:hypothetical protein DSAG12_02032 [Promethearchaeum syntrophicum]|uniref:Uncharacterized protein n=1 Tax=Promethearchaeum syntrophicum TaxID=2594042 RepID=A0A5B9DAS0_9ARCH
MIWKKQKIQLLTILEEIENLQPVSKPVSDLDLFLLKWMKVRRICLDGVKDPTLSKDDKSLLNGLILKFSQKVQPKLLEFSKAIKKKPMGENLLTFKSKLDEFFEEGQQFLSILPIKSYSIYEDALFFINIYQFAFNPSVSKIAKLSVFKKINLIKDAFEVEAGQENLEKKQSQLSKGLSNSLKGTSPSAPPAEPSQEDMMNEGDIMIGNLSLPEEEMESFKEELEESVVISLPEPIPQPSIKPIADEVSSKVTYPYFKWFPSQSWNDFANYRYCYQCGHVIDSSNAACTGCQRQF